MASAIDCTSDLAEPSTADSPTLDEPTKARGTSQPDDGPDTFDDETRLRGDLDDFDDETRLRGDFDDATRKRGDETRARFDDETRDRGAANDDYEVETRRNNEPRHSGMASTRRQISVPLDTDRTLDPAEDDYGDRRSSAPPTIKDPTLDGEDESYARESYARDSFDRGEDSGARARPFDPSLPANQTALLREDENKIEPGPVRTTAPMPPPIQAPAAYGPPQAPPHAVPMALMPTQHSPANVAVAPRPMPSPMPPPSFGYNPPPRMIPVGHVSFGGPGIAAMEQPRVLHRPAAGVPPRQPTTRAEGEARHGHARLLPGTPFSWLAWFVFGTAFGLFFAFFATGFFARFTKEDAPQAAAAPAVTAPVVTAPPPAAPPPPAATEAAAAPAPTTPAPIATVAPATTPAAPAPPAASVVAAAAPASPTAAPVVRPRPHHRASPPRSNSNSDDDSPSTRGAAKDKPPADVGDLLNAGLAP